MAKVWRLENEKGQGFYTGDHWYDLPFWVSDATNDGPDGRHPTPYNDPGLMDKSYLQDQWDQLRFGFETIDSAFAWFSRKVREAVEPVGIRLSMYEVPDEYVEKGQYQVVFDGAHAKRLHSFKPTEEENTLRQYEKGQQYVEAA